MTGWEDLAAVAAILSIIACIKPARQAIWTLLLTPSRLEQVIEHVQQIPEIKDEATAAKRAAEEAVDLWREAAPGFGHRLGEVERDVIDLKALTTNHEGRIAALEQLRDHG